VIVEVSVGDGIGVGVFVVVGVINFVAVGTFVAVSATVGEAVRVEVTEKPIGGLGVSHPDKRKHRITNASSCFFRI
jgi:hypothetical protein